MRYDEDKSRDLKLMTVLYRCFHSVNKSDNSNIRGYGLTSSQFEVLEILYHKGDLRVQDIIDKTLSSSGNIGVVIDNLVKDGLVERIRSEEDRRVRFISLTNKGKDIIREIFPTHIENIQKIFKTLDNSEKEELTKLLKKLGKSI